MKLLVLGASGGCGQWVVKLAQQRGHDVTAVVRPSSSYVAPEGVTLLYEDVSNNGVIEHILTDYQTIISCLGMNLSKPGNPFSTLLSPPDLMSSVARQLCSSMPAHGIQRVISISAGGVADSLAHTNWLMQFFIARSSLAVPYADLATMETIYAKSGLDWLAVRPVTLKEEGPTNTAKTVPFYRLSSKITKGEVARWMLNAAEQTKPFFNHTPMIAGS